DVPRWLRVRSAGVAARNQGWTVWQGRRGPGTFPMGDHDVFDADLAQGSTRRAKERDEPRASVDSSLGEAENPCGRRPVARGRHRIRRSMRRSGTSHISATSAYIAIAV